MRMAGSPDGSIWTAFYTEEETITLAGTPFMDTHPAPGSFQTHVGSISKFDPGIALRLELDPNLQVYPLGETFVVTASLTHPSPVPATYSFPDGPFEFDPAYFEYRDPSGAPLTPAEPGEPLLQPIEPFELKIEDGKREFKMPVIPIKSGATKISTKVVVTDPDGTRTLELEIPVVFDPLDPLSRMAITSSGIGGFDGGFSLHLATVAGVTYVVEQSPDMSAGSWSDAITFTASGIVSVVRLPADGDARFHRVRAAGF